MWSKYLNIKLKTNIKKKKEKEVLLGNKETMIWSSKQSLLSICLYAMEQKIISNDLLFLIPEFSDD